MKKRDFILLSIIILSGAYCKAQQKKDSLEKNIQEIIISAKAPISKEKFTQKQLENKNLGQDIPYLLKNSLSAISSSDAGSGIGYTNIRIRGSDQTRINVTLNDVPINNAESQGPFWVNMPDLASSISNITIQRGVGTSTEGTGSFGASINIKTQYPEDSAYFQTDQSIGSFNTYKHTFALGSGKFYNNLLKMDARISFIKSEGYLDRAFSDLFSYYVNGMYEKQQTKISFMVFGGKQQTYQAWNGIDYENMKKRRTFNSCGAIYDSDGNIIRYYNNETDNYWQDNYHLYGEQKINGNWKLKSTLFYVKGKGYYEEYKQNSKLKNYKLKNIILSQDTITTTDLVRRQWLKNNFYGITNHLIGKFDKWNLEIGLGFNTYDGKHFGKVIWAEYFPESTPDHEYYRNKALKNEISGNIKALYKISDYWDLFGDVQYRNIHYSGHDVPGGESIYKNGGPLYFSKNYNFINPKIGVTYTFKTGNVYLTYGMAQKEPNRNDVLSNENIKSELLHNIELGVQQNFSNFSYSINGYGMYYINQLVLSGKINDVGSFIRENSGKSYRMGIELSAEYKFSSQITFLANSTISTNKNINFKKEIQSVIHNLGNTDIAFSPNYIGNISIQWIPLKKLTAKWSHQYISSQYLNNEEPTNGKLKGYYTSDISLEYSPKILKIKNLSLKLLLNNIFNNLYKNNGYYSDNIPYYYPQAGFNFLIGISIKL